MLEKFKFWWPVTRSFLTILAGFLCVVWGWHTGGLSGLMLAWLCIAVGQEFSRTKQALEVWAKEQQAVRLPVAFDVVCDETNNTPEHARAGVVIVDVTVRHADLAGARSERDGKAATVTAPEPHEHDRASIVSDDVGDTETCACGAIRFWKRAAGGLVQASWVEKAQTAAPEPTLEAQLAEAVAQRKAAWSAFLDSSDSDESMARAAHRASNARFYEISTAISARAAAKAKR